MKAVTIHLVGTAEEVREALRVLAGYDTLLPVIATPAVIDGNKEPITRKGPYSAVLCARDGCHNKLTVKQVKQGSKYCGLRCAGLARRGMVRGSSGVPVDAAGVTIVAGEGVVKGSVLSEEVPVPS